MARRSAFVVAVALVVLAGCSSGGDPSSTGEVIISGPSETPAPSTGDSEPGDGATIGDGQIPEGFTTVTVRITETDGEVCEVCVWLADSSEERARGLMGVTDLGDAVAMVFEFEEPLAGSFYMFQTPTPLSIAWFADSGEHLSSADMAPCIDMPAGECPLYSPGAEYQYALEVFEGALTDLGIGPGARLELVAGTEAERCPLASP